MPCGLGKHRLPFFDLLTFSDFLSSKHQRSSVSHLELESFLVPLKSFPISYDLLLLKVQYLHKNVLAINLIVNPKDIIQRTN